MPIPEHIKIHQPKGTEIKLISNHYYVYEVKCIYDKTKKKNKKISGKYLGKITNNGFVPSPTHELKSALQVNPSVKEYGGYLLSKELLKEELPLLQQYFPHHWEMIFFLCYTRVVYNARFKMLEHYYRNSYFIIESDEKISEEKVSKVTRVIGEMRDKIVEFKQQLIGNGEYLLIDSTNVFTNSNGISQKKKGYNSKHIFNEQVRLMYIVSSELQMPVYYRIVGGNIPDVKALKLCLLESGLSNVMLISDKGFYSTQNIKLLTDESMKYIIPIHRSKKIIDYSGVDKPGKEGFAGYFIYRQRVIWYYSYQTDGGLLHLFQDLRLKTTEEEDYLDKIAKYPEDYTMEDFLIKSKTFGTIALLCSETDVDAQKVYLFYKSRVDIEVVFDTFKNTLMADTTYMRNDCSLEGWMFVNFLAVRMYYKLMKMLREKELLKKYSPMDIIKIASQIHKIKIHNAWLTNEVTKKDIALLSNFSLHIT